MDPSAALDVKGFQETRKLLAKMVLVIAAVPGQSLGLLLSVATLTTFSPCSENTKIYISLMLEVSVMVKVTSHLVTKNLYS